MLTTLLSALASGVLMTAVFCIALLFCMLGNTVLGVSLSLKTDLFDPKILFSGLLKNLLFIVGTIFLGAGIVSFSTLLNYYNIVAENITNFVNITGLIIVIAGLAYSVYIKQGIEKMKEFGGLKADAVITTDPLEGKGENPAE